MPSVIQLIKLKIPLIPAVTWGFFGLYLTLRPKSAGDIFWLPICLEGLPVDKVAHFVFWGIWYGLYGIFFLNRDLSAKPLSPKINTKQAVKERVLGIFILMVVGALIEIAQDQLNWGREAEWADLAADAAGVLAVAFYFRKQ